jgi:hypothetical protein
MGILSFHGSILLPLYLFGTVAAWLATLVLYRRFFHPIARIPGPFLASITHFYIVYYNLFSGKSQFYLQVEKLHDKYGKCFVIAAVFVRAPRLQNLLKRCG